MNNVLHLPESTQPSSKKIKFGAISFTVDPDSLSNKTDISPKRSLERIKKAIEEGVFSEPEEHAADSYSSQAVHST